MGGFITSMRTTIFGECMSYLQDFPSNIHKLSLPYVIIDNLSLFCTGGGKARAFNAISHVGITVGCLLLASKYNKIGSILNPLIGKSDMRNAFIIYYGGFNAATLLIGLLSPSDDDEPPTSATDWILHPGRSIKWMVEHVKLQVGTPLICDKETEDYDAGLCYKLQSDAVEKSYKFIGPIGWPHCGYENSYDKSKFRDDGAFCWKRNTYDRGIGFVPKGCEPDKEYWGGLCYKKCPKNISKRTASCTCNFGKIKGVYTNARAGIGKLELGEECRQLNWTKVGKNRQIFKDHGVGWYKSAHISCQSHGLISSCSRYGRGTVPKKCINTTHPVYQTGLCYRKPKHHFKCTATYCSRLCPRNTVNLGPTCSKKSITRGVGKPIHTCDKDKIKVGLLCYKKCSTIGDEWHRKGAFCIKNSKQTKQNQK